MLEETEADRALAILQRSNQSKAEELAQLGQAMDPMIVLYLRSASVLAALTPEQRRYADMSFEEGIAEVLESALLQQRLAQDAEIPHFPSPRAKQ